MLNTTIRSLLVAAASAAALSSPGGAAAQNPPLTELRKKPESIGMDTRTFDLHFGDLVKAQRPAAAPSDGIEALADQVGELRIFLTRDPKVVRGEIAIVGKTLLTELRLSIDKEPVRFADSGRSGDKSKGDGVFSATLPMDTAAAFKLWQQDVRASAELLSGDARATLVRRGPRDIVDRKQALEDLRVQSPKVFTGLAQSAERAAQLAKFSDPLEAAKALNIDITKTAFFTLPGPRSAELDRPRLPMFFDLPVLRPFPAPAPAPVPIDEARSLMVVAPGVVEDPGRSFDACSATGTPGAPWSFGHLMREMAQGTGLTPEDFVRQWLSTWAIGQEANGFVVNEPGRAAQLQTRVIDSWQRLSPGGVFNVDFFPARLLAIANRPDLADRIGYGSAGSAGEGRLVFGLLNKPSAAAPCNSMPFTVIFEYGVKGGSCTAVKAWHQRWKDLDTLALGSPAYNAALEGITRAFTDHGSNPAQLPNQSALNQLRTNENALNPLWQLREFRLQPPGMSVPAGMLDLVTVKQTPDNGFDNSATLAAYLASAEGDILADRHVVPDRFPSVLDPFLGAKNDAPFGGFWTAPALGALANPAETRRKFSLNTCNACHTGETNTFFTHIGSLGQRAMGSPAALSGFLTGINVNVPVSGGVHHYADLAEREIAMSNILNQSCFGLLGVRRLPFVH